MLFRYLTLVLTALLSLSSGPDLIAQGGTTIISSPAVPTGTPNNFGRLVDRWNSRVIIADDTEVAIYNELTQSFESNALLIGVVGPVDSVDDVAIQSPYAAVAYTKGGFSFVQAFTFNGTQWILGPGLGIPPGLGPASARLAFDGSLTTPALVVATTPNGVTTQVFGYDFFFNAITGFKPLAQPGVPVNIACGTMPGANSLGVAVTLETPIEREVVPLSWNLSSFTLNTVSITQGGPSSDMTFGDSLALAEGTLWIGVPGTGVAPNPTGHVLRSRISPSGVQSTTPIVGGIAGAGFGRTVAASGDVALIAQGGTGALLAGSNDVGFVHTYRKVGVSWIKTDELSYTESPSNADPREFGRALSVSGFPLSVAFGEPGGALADGRVLLRTLPSDSIFDTSESSSLSGAFGEAPTVRLIGNTLTGAPFGLFVSDALPSSVGYLVLGFTDVSVPFKGGVLFPSTDIVRTVPIDANGELALITSWPDAGVAGFELLGQVWVTDPVGPAGFSASAGFSVRQD